MTAPSASSGLRREVAEIVDAGQFAEREGDRPLARAHFERALRALRGDEGEHAPALIRRIARSYIDEGVFDAALDCLAAAQHLSRARGDISGVAHAVNQMASANLQRGDLDAAEALFNKAQALAETANDASLEAMVSQNLGIAAKIRGNLDGALGHFQHSLALFSEHGLADYIGPVMNNLAMTFAALSRWTEAEAAFDRALLEARRTGNTPARRMIEVNQVDMWLSRGDIRRAGRAARVLYAEASSAGDARALGEVAKHLGVIARFTGELADAEEWFAESFATATRREDLLLSAETAREQAELYEMLGRNQETLRALGQSHRLFTKLKAEHNLADLAARVERLETRFFDIVQRWAQTIESKDPYTLGHCERVAEYACALAREAGLEDLTMFWFRIGALLHDVGKIEVPTEILAKNGPLTAEERRVMERHAAAGADLLRDIEFPWDVLPMIRGHHERWDGGGYPDRLAGESIPVTARVLCIADVFDALASDRPYRAAYPRDEALAIMKRDVGKAFDPDLFDRFLKVVMRPGTSMDVAASRSRISVARDG